MSGQWVHSWNMNLYCNRVHRVWYNCEWAHSTTMRTCALIWDVVEISGLVFLFCFPVLFFSRPSPKAGRELQTALDTRIMENNGWPLASRSRSPGRESTQRLCTCSALFWYFLFCFPVLTKYWSVWQSGILERDSGLVSWLVDWEVGFPNSTSKLYEQGS